MNGIWAEKRYGISAYLIYSHSFLYREISPSSLFYCLLFKQNSSVTEYKASY